MSPGSRCNVKAGWLDGWQGKAGPSSNDCRGGIGGVKSRAWDQVTSHGTGGTMSMGAGTWDYSVGVRYAVKGAQADEGDNSYEPG